MLRTVAKRSVELLPAQAQSFIRSVWLDRSLRHFPETIVRHNYGGVQLDINLADSLAARWYDSDWLEPMEVSFLKNHSLRSGSRVFDLGAHQGIVALMLAAAVGNFGSVIALEANPHNAKVLRKNVATNRATNVNVLNAAVSSSVGTLSFNKDLNGQVNGGKNTYGRFEIASRTVDDLADEFGHPDLLFIDVEGFECEVMLGAKQTLALGVDCFIEVHGGVGLEKFGGSISGLLSFFPEERFNRFFTETSTSPFLPMHDVRHLEGKRWFFIAIQK